MAFSRTWNTAYESSPADTDDISNDAQVARQLKVDVRERLEIDHSWAGDANDGHHKKATMRKRSSDPSAVTDSLVLFTKGVTASLYGVDPRGAVISISVPVGTPLPWTGSTEPAGYVFADGRTIGDSGSGADHEGPEFEDLFEHFKAEGSAFGNAGTEDWSNLDTIKLPDMRDRSVVGTAAMGSTDAGRVNNYTTALGDVGGADQHQLSNAEMPSHNHGGSTGSGGSHDHGAGFWLPQQGTVEESRPVVSTQDVDQNRSQERTTSAGNHSHSISTAGSDNAHNNMHPFIALNWIVKY